MDLTGFPLPDNAPDPGACIRLERPEDGLAILRLDPPHRSLAVLDGPLLRDLESAVAGLEADSSLRGVVITGRDPGRFAAGADVLAIHGITDPAVVERVVREVHRLFRRVEDLAPTTVAAVGGPVPGGALELSLCCDYIVATDDPKTRLGLPETQLGILPGWGGSHRLPRRIGVPAALNAILSGRLFSARAARKLGIADRLAKPEYLVRVACDIALGRHSARRRRRGWKSWAVDRNPLAIALVRRQARKQVLAKTRGHYPAPMEALEIVSAAPRTSWEEAVEKEAAAVGRLATGAVCKNLISIFLASEEAKKLGKGPEGFQPRRFGRAGVLGGGVMGAGIASLLAGKGIATRLMDLSAEALDEALLAHRADVEKKRRRRRLAPHESRAAIDRLVTTTTLQGFSRAEIVIEAVAERLEVKREVFGVVSGQAGPQAVLATNTSSLSVDAIADGLPHPERVCGMHFFNPVRKMPLVEVVRGSRTSDETVAEVAALALRLGKTPVVVRDVAGFLVNRLLGPYLDEAVRLFVAGAEPQHVDRLMVAFGMPMGPFRLLDEVGLDIAAHAAASLEAAYGERMIPCQGIARLSGPHRLGRKTGRGFYVHPGARSRKPAKPVPADDLAGFQTSTVARSFSDSQIVDRLVLSMVNEAARCLEEGVVESPAALDLATVFGTGFAPFRGGVLRHADSLGLAAVTERLEAIAAAGDVASRPGGSAKFSPADLLRDLAAKGTGFHGGPCSPAPAAPPLESARA